MPSSTKPKLAQLQTPLTSTFPSELSALSARSPLPGFADFIKQEEGLKTPITPPLAYTDFLKTMASPTTTGDSAGDNKSSGRTTPTSAPSTGSEHSDCSCNCETHKSPTSAPAGQFVFPSSAPSTGRLSRLRIPPSPAFSGLDSPLSANATSAMRSPFSARSARSPFDWDFKPGSSKGRYHFDVKSPKCGRSSIRQVREIVTRTVTYTHTPQMSPAPKGKRRKVE